jgi:hypothetical protein
MQGQPGLFNFLHQQVQLGPRHPAIPVAALEVFEQLAQQHATLIADAMIRYFFLIEKLDKEGRDIPASPQLAAW